ncbi:hypothetical protein JCM3775_002541 [Rhodotorula graminis]
MDDLDFGVYCVVCDRAIPLASSPSFRAAGSVPPAPPPPPPPYAPPPVASTSNQPAPSTSQRSRTSDGSSAAAAAASAAPTRTKRSASTASSGTGAGLRRNKSTVKVHARTGGHGHGHAHGHRSHSHANLAGLAPLDPAKQARKAALAERRPSKAAKEEIIEVIAVHDGVSDDDGDDARHAAPQGIYCSEECRLVDEARNALALAHLGASPAAGAFGESALVGSGSPSSSSFASMRPTNAMVRRRSSGVSSAGFSSASSFAASRSNLSPIPSAAPTAAVARSDESTTSSFPFPPQPSSSAPPPSRSSGASTPIASSAPTPQPPPLLNFAARRRSRGHEATGGYSYRPSLMERVSSSEGRPVDRVGGQWLGADRGFSRPSSSGGDVTTRASRSSSIGSSGGGSRTHSADAGTRFGDSSGRPPSALASLRSITPLHEAPPSHSSAMSASPVRAAYLPRSNSAQPDLATSPLAHHSYLVGSAPTSSAPVPRRRGPSIGEPTVPESRPLDLSTASTRTSTGGVQRAQRSASSASLALMGTSLGKSHEPRAWAGPNRTASSASLSGFVAQGELTLPGSVPPPLPAVSSSATSTVIPAGSSPSPSSALHAPSSPSSTSSYAPSHSSAFSGHSSTAGSSEHHPSSSLGSTHAPPRGKSGSRGRHGPALTMTPSGTNLAAAGLDLHPTRPPPPSSNVVNAASANPALSYLKGADEPAKPSLPDPPAAHQRSFSWQQIPGVPTYSAYDVEGFRAAKASASTSTAGGARAAEREGREREGPMLPPPAPAPSRPGRKRLFYFSDEQGGE